MTTKDLGYALELSAQGIPYSDIADYFGVDTIDLYREIQNVTTFRNVNDRINNVLIVKESKINQHLPDCGEV